MLYAALHDLAVRTVPNWLPALLLGLGFGVRLQDHSLLGGLLVAPSPSPFSSSSGCVGAHGRRRRQTLGRDRAADPAAAAARTGVFPVASSSFGGALALLYLGLGWLVPKPGPRARAGRRCGGCLRTEAWRIGRRAPLPYACAIAGGAIVSLLPLSLQR